MGTKACKKSKTLNLPQRWMKIALNPVSC